MRAVSFLALLLAGSGLSACSATPAPSCQNPTPRQQSCNSCSADNCGSQLSAVSSHCPDYVSCYEACDCSDTECIAGCASDAVMTTSCVTAGSALALCIQFNCPASACGATVDGGSREDGGEGADAACPGFSDMRCDGVCVDTSIDPDNCGTCGTKCASVQVCGGGDCVCPSGSLCNGACVDKETDPDNCGNCTVKCAAPETCQSGACGCPSGGSLCGGACVDTRTDSNHCGACGTTCPSVETCQGGACKCPEGGLFCGAVCVAGQSDPNNCGACGMTCSGPTPYCAFGTCIATPAPNCAPGGAGLSNCGASSESCCTSLEVAGGTFFRTYDPATDAGIVTGPDGSAAGEADPATVSSFSLDKYPVTVGRFRQFVNAWNGGAGYTPMPGSGIHAHLNGGKGLVALGVVMGGGGVEAGVTDAGPRDATLPDGGGVAYETGWVADYNGNIAPTGKNLACDPTYAPWTAAAGSNESLPMTCLTWQEAYAFCIWDGGFLPSEAEWDYVAAGGDEQLEYPWGSAPPGASNQYAVYGDSMNNCYYPTGVLTPCTGFANIAPVGTATLGAALWGQLDMAGEVNQWALDRPATFVDPSIDGAYLGPSTHRSVCGGNYASNRLTPHRASDVSTDRHPWVGFRCARAP